jgi:putative nucleotidyltransferase with HDIG domain
MQPTRSELIKQHIDSFPVLPATVTRLIRVTSDPECSVQDVVETLHSDQSLCLTVLKIANSVLFGRPRKIDSIKMAVVALGFNEVQRIALAKALVNSFSKIAGHHKPAIDRFWQHSFVCAMAAGNIARELRMNPDAAFMGGLLHDIGKLIMLQTFADDYAPERWMTALSNEANLHEELRMFSFTHDMLGGRLLQKWSFPENLISGVAYHHRPGEAGNEKALAQLIQLADVLSFFSCHQELLEEKDILTAVHASLPDIQLRWHGFGASLQNKAITGWFDWLVENQEQATPLKEAFSV